MASQLGFGSIELMVTPAKTTYQVDYLKKLIQEYQLPITSIHAPTLLLCKFVFGTHPYKKAKKSLELADAVGADTVVIHPPYKSNPYSKVLLASTKELNEQYDAQVAVENMFPYTIRGHAKEMYGPSYQETIDSSDLPLTFDFSHASLSGLDPVRTVKENAPRIRMMHLTDGSTRSACKGDPIRDEHLLPGDGDMPLEETYDVLRAAGWAGHTTLEINTRHAHTVEERALMLEKSLAFYNERLRVNSLAVK